MKYKKLKEKSIEFDKTKEGQELNSRLKKVVLNGCLCLILSVIYLIWNILDHSTWPYYLLVIGLFVFGIVFIRKAYAIKSFEVNRFYYTNAKNKKKS